MYARSGTKAEAEERSVTNQAEKLDKRWHNAILIAQSNLNEKGQSI